eukprot:UN31445
MCILIYFVQSWRFIFIPLVNVVITLYGSFSILYAISLVWTSPPSFIPSVIEVFSIAMNIDYSLFLLTRFGTEKFSHEYEHEVCVSRTLQYAGHVVLMSGTTLLFCSLGLVLFKSNFIQLTGLGMAITLFVAMFVNLTLTPALLLSFPKFFIFQLCCFMKHQNSDPNAINDSSSRSHSLVGNTKKNQKVGLKIV